MIDSVVQTFSIPGMTAGGVYVKDEYPASESQKGLVQYRAESEEPLGYRLVSGTYQLWTLPRSQIISGQGMSGQDLMRWTFYSTDMREPAHLDARRWNEYAEAEYSLLRLACPWQAVLVQMPNNDACTGVSKFILDVDNLSANSETLLQTVEARCYWVELWDTHLTDELIRRFYTVNMPAISVDFTVTLASRTVDLTCVWHMSERHQITPSGTLSGLMIPHIYASSMDAAPGNLVSCPLLNRPMDARRRSWGFIRAETPNGISGTHRPLEEDAAPSSHSVWGSYAFGHTPIRTKYTGGADDRRVLIEFDYIDGNSPEDASEYESWRCAITRGGIYTVVGGDETEIASIASGEFASKTYLEGAIDIVARNFITDVSTIGAATTDVYADLRWNIVVTRSGGSGDFVFDSGYFRPLHDDLWPCPFSSVPWPGITGSTGRAGLWWNEAPADQWTANTSSITATDNGEGSLLIDVVDDWELSAEPFLGFSGPVYQPQMTVYDTEGRRLRWQLLDQHSDVSRPVTNTTVVVDISHEPDGVLIEVQLLAQFLGHHKMWRKYVDLTV